MLTRPLKHIGLFITFGAALLSGCRRDQPAKPDRLPRPQMAVASMPDAAEIKNRTTECAAQAARVAAHGVWRGSSMKRPADGPLRWVGHYSEKYDECYVLIDQVVPVQNGAAAVVSELWDAFDATVLAEATDDHRTSVRRSFCQVTLDDDPFTSCMVSKYFIDEHMSH
jgi:hypothetical protein